LPARGPFALLGAERLRHLRFKHKRQGKSGTIDIKAVLAEDEEFLRALRAITVESLIGPRAPVVEAPEARHHVMLDQPLAFVAALRMLLDSWMRNEPVGSGYIADNILDADQK